MKSRTNSVISASIGSVSLVLTTWLFLQFHVSLGEATLLFMLSGIFLVPLKFTFEMTLTDLLCSAIAISLISISLFCNLYNTLTFLNTIPLILASLMFFHPAYLSLKSYFEEHTKLSVIT